MPLQVLTISCLEIYLLYLSGVHCGFYVKHERSNICGLKGASAVLPCRFEYHGMGFYLGGEWYEERRKRVARKYPNYHPDCSLSIDKLSHDQSGIYHFRFRTSLRKNGNRGTPGVTLSVTDLRVKEEAVVGNQNQTKLTCSTSCSLGSQYVWYKNGQQLQDKTTASIILDSTTPSEEGSYSCAVRGHEAHRSPAVCAPEKQCWGVTYSSTSICALLGASVDIPCTYKYLEDRRVKTTFWFNKQKSCNHPEDLRLDENFENHVEYIGNKENNCTLRLKDIRESHSGEYAFRFTTEQGESYSGLPGVTITVTPLQVTPPPKPVIEGKSVTLTCITTCTLSNIPIFTWYSNGTSKHTTRDNKLHLNPVSSVSEDAGSYSCAVRGHESVSSMPVILNVRFLQVFITSEMAREGERVTLTCNSTRGLSNNSTFTWYKNGQPVTYKHTTRDNKLHLNPVSSEDAGNYSCAVRGHEHLSSIAVFLSVRYKPKDISVSLSPSEGSLVTLTCSSDANPPVHNYTWYMKSGAESLFRGTGESISFNMTSDTSGLYFCEAQNEMGSQNSGAVSVPKEASTTLLCMLSTATSDGCAGLIVAIILVSILLFAIILICMYRIAYTRRNTQTKKQEAHSDDTYTALNPRDKSSEYDTLQNVRSLGDTYMPLQRRGQEYETLQRRESPQAKKELKDPRIKWQHKP